ncbi:MAG: hypothetical protein RLZZ210_125 [Pseudomonadota bacterium]|jgi:DNA helicase-2/ATP-dependent DNA helicase PcrA
MNILDNLNTQQHQAVTLLDKHALILAGAGSGKTKVLTTRIAWLLNQGMASPYSILAVTFTNKAAKEMQERLSHMVNFNIRHMFIGTFHGLCHRLLRLHANDAKLPHDFQIMDMQDQASFIKKMLKEQNIDENSLDPKLLINFINQAKERGERSHQVSINKDRFGGKLIQLYKQYEESCQKNGVVDFAELLLRCDELFTNNHAIMHHYQQRFKYVLIDEFQDTNSLQYAWLKRFYNEESIYFAVGDDDQSIYSFRGARVKNMQDFEREFQIENIIKLEQNYRSQGNILKCANALIDNNGQRLGKNLFTTSGDGEKIKLYSGMDDNLEASWVANSIVKHIDNGDKPQEIAILYRSNAQSRAFEHILFKQHIPYKVYGGLRFFERAEIKHAIAYLQLIDNLTQNIAFLRVINFPTRGIGAKTLEQIQEIASNLDLSLYEASSHLAGKAKINVEQFIELIQKMKFEAQHLNLADTIEYMLQASGLLNHYEQDKDNEDRINNLKELISAAHNFYQEEKIPHDTSALQMLDLKELELEHLPPNISPLRLFLSYTSLESGGDNNNGQQGVQLMTIHASKGLEFKNVFITGVEEGIFPNENNACTEDDIEEERRLMYVAITRARQNLYISSAQARMLYGKTSFNRPSRFLEELPEENIKWLSPKPFKKSSSYREDNSNGEYSRSDDDVFSFANNGNNSNRYDSYNKSSSYKYKEDMPNWLNRNKTEQIYKKEAAEANAEAQKIAVKHTKVIQDDKEFRIGSKVFSTKFGEGTIKSIEGSGENALARISFKKHGEKILNLGMANLSLI